MAAGVLGVEPLEQPGVYRASLADGSSMLVHGAPGEALFKRYGPKEATGPDALASNDAGMSIPQENMSRADAGTIGPPPPPEPSGPVTPKKLEGGGVSIPLSAARAITRGEKVLEAPPAPPQTPEAAPPGQPGAAPQPPTQAPVRDQAGPLGYNMKGIDPATGKEIQGAAVRDSAGNIGILLPGSRGTAGGLTTLGKEKLAHDAAAEAEVARQRQLEDQARQTGVDAAKQEADERAAYLDEAKVQAQLAIQQQQDEQAKIQQHVDKLQGAYDKARDDFLNSKVDPDEYMKRGHGAVGIFSAIGVALSQFGGAFTGQPNVAAQFVNNQIDRSIRAQEAAINVKGKAADNMLADLTRETGSLSSAKLAMKQILTEKAAIEIQGIGAGTKSQQLAAQNNEIAAKLAQQNAILDNERKQRAQAEAMTNPLYYRRGTAGSAPRIALPTQESAGKMQEQALKVKEFELSKQKAEAERVKAAGAGTPIPSDRADKIATATSGIAAALQVRQELEGRGVTGDASDDPTAGPIDRTRHMESNERLNQATTELAKGVQGAFGKSDRDAADAEKMATGGGSGRDRYQAAERLEKKLVGNLRTELSTLPPEQAKKLLSTMPAEVRAKVLAEPTEQH